jgi:hypothetical protein
MDTENPDDNPIQELQELIEKSGPDVSKLFGLALTIFAGQSAASKDEKQKRSELEKIILGN